MQLVTMAFKDGMRDFNDFDIQVTSRTATRTNFTLTGHLNARTALNTLWNVDGQRVPSAYSTIA
jgi:hypothetical protein